MSDCKIEQLEAPDGGCFKVRTVLLANMGTRSGHPCVCTFGLGLDS